MNYGVDKWILAALVLLLLAIAVTMSLVAGSRKDTIDMLEDKTQELVVQNVQVKKQAYIDGILACQEEDIAYLTDLSNTTESEALSTLFIRMAAGWAYDEETLDTMVDDYMNGDIIYE